MSDAKLSAGDVEITLNGKTYVMRPTLKACLSISRQSGGILEAVRRVGSYDFDQIVAVLSAGLEREDKEELSEEIFRNGVVTLAAPAIKFLTVIANGGAHAAAEGEGPGEKDPPKASA